MTAKKEEFRMLSDREHILHRPAMWIGSVDEGEFQEYILENDKIIYKPVNYVPGFMKIINEIIDNAIDEAVRTGFKFATKVNVSFDDEANTITVEDNGRGIPVEQISGEWKPKLAWTMARAGTNFEEGHLGPGANGVGSCATNCYSALFIGDTNDGSKRCIVTCKNNMEEIDVKIKEGNKQKQGTKVTFQPDLKRFKLTPKKVFSNDSVYKQLIYQRLLNLSICYPNITFKCDGKTLKTNNIKNIMKMFGESFEFANNDNCIVAIFPNPDDDFRQFSYMNGLKIANGGSHIDVLVNDVVQGIREKLLKKYKSIKPGEIKSKLFVVMYGNNFTNPKYESQTKERITNSTADIRAFLEGIDTEKLIKQCLKNDNLIDPIVEVYKIKEEYANRKAIEGAVTTKKKVTSKKYLPATLRQKYLVLGEGKSAVGGLSAALGREEFGFFELRGVPLSAEKCTLVEFLANEEMKLLMQILNVNLAKKKEDLAKHPITYEYIVFGTDFDADGAHIRGLLLSMARKYLPHLLNEGRILQLKTPIIALHKGKDIKHYFFTIDDFNAWARENDMKPYRLKYYKGLGSWNADALIKLFETEGMDKFLVPFIFDEEANETILSWFLGDRVNYRKEKLMNYDFNVAVV